MTFVFGLLTYIIIVKLRQGFEAVGFHILTNSIAVLISLKIGMSLPLLIGAIIIIAV